MVGGAVSEDSSQSQGDPILSKDLSSQINKDAALHPMTGLENCSGSHRPNGVSVWLSDCPSSSNEPSTVIQREKQ